VEVNWKSLLLSLDEHYNDELLEVHLLSFEC